MGRLLGDLIVGKNLKQWKDKLPQFCLKEICEVDEAVEDTLT